MKKEEKKIKNDIKTIENLLLQGHFEIALTKAIFLPEPARSSTLNVLVKFDLNPDYFFSDRALDTTLLIAESKRTSARRLILKKCIRTGDIKLADKICELTRIKLQPTQLEKIFKVMTLTGDIQQVKDILQRLNRKITHPEAISLISRYIVELQYKMPESAIEVANMLPKKEKDEQLAKIIDNYMARGFFQHAKTASDLLKKSANVNEEKMIAIVNECWDVGNYENFLNTIDFISEPKKGELLKSYFDLYTEDRGHTNLLFSQNLIDKMTEPNKSICQEIICRLCLEKNKFGYILFDEAIKILSLSNQEKKDEIIEKYIQQLYNEDLHKIEVMIRMLSEKKQEKQWDNYCNYLIKNGHTDHYLKCMDLRQIYPKGEDLLRLYKINIKRKTLVNALTTINTIDTIIPEPEKHSILRKALDATFKSNEERIHDFLTKIAYDMKDPQRTFYLKKVLTFFINQGRLEQSVMTAERLSRDLTKEEVKTITKINVNNGYLEKAMETWKVLSIKLTLAQLKKIFDVCVKEDRLVDAKKVSDMIMEMVTKK
jgi:hypothetical protein